MSHNLHSGTFSDLHDLVVEVGHLGAEGVRARVLLQLLRLEVLEPQDRAHLVPRRAPETFI